MQLPRVTETRATRLLSCCGVDRRRGPCEIRGLARLLEPEVLNQKTLADGTVVVESQRGQVRLSRLGSGVVFFVCSGALSERFYAPMVELAQREIDAAGRLSMFVDGQHLKSVDTGFRETWTEWFKRYKTRFVMRLLVRTKLMDMAASLANLMTGISVINSYSNVHSWQEACRRDYPAFRYEVEETRPERLD